MREGRPSDTASYVAMGRALAHAHKTVPGFDDPFALRLLPDDCRWAVEHALFDVRSRSPREWVLRAIASSCERMMGPRTVTIDRGLEELAPGFQLVVVGAGLDARAHRMPVLSQSAAFEVDHPATQAFKRERTKDMPVVAKSLTYVAVDFEKEKLGDALERSGHRRELPTAWVFEGVISYLKPSDVADSLAQMAERSGPGSRLLATYNAPTLARRVISVATSLGGEPQKASFEPPAMHALLASKGFTVARDLDAGDRLKALGLTLPKRELAWVQHHHVVIADRVPEKSEASGS